MALGDVDQVSSWPSGLAWSRADLANHSGTGYRHLNREGANFCFADGHIEAKRHNAIPADIGNSSEQNYFWGSLHENQWY